MNERQTALSDRISSALAKVIKKKKKKKQIMLTAWARSAVEPFLLLDQRSGTRCWTTSKIRREELKIVILRWKRFILWMLSTFSSSEAVRRYAVDLLLILTLLEHDKDVECKKGKGSGFI